MAFDPDINSILQYATNFFASAAPVGRIIMGTAIGGFVLGTLIGIVIHRRNA